ncbi:MAG: CARDB domain-containing protein [Rhodobacter sp.]|nr:CARDB domain-containing protein [Rhodobacter sp.]
MTARQSLKALAVAGAIALLSAVPVLSQPNLIVSEFEMTPATPVQGQPVNVRVGVYNNGNVPAGPFTVRWWPGENYPSHACSWNVPSLALSGGRILTCTYAGYPSWYAQIRTRVLVDAGNTVPEGNEADNDRRYRIRVNQPPAAAKPNLFISEMSLNPPVPTQGQPVQVRIGVYNNGDVASGPTRVAWWPGENYPAPACTWNVSSMNRNGGRILTCTYSGYPSWYSRIRTKAEADVNGMVDEKDEGDNARLMQIQVRKP